MPEYQKSLSWPDREGEFFQRAQTLSTTPGENGWTIHDTSAAGAPTTVVGASGAVLTLAADSEAEVLSLYHNDVLQFDIDEIRSMTFYAKVSGVDAVTAIVMGLGSARNGTLDSVAANAWFRMQGSASTTLVVTESDDGTNDNDDKATSVTLSSTFKKFVIDFSRGKADVRFFIDGLRVSSATTFDMSNYSSGLQPIFELQKASGTGVPALTVTGVLIKHNKLID